MNNDYISLSTIIKNQREINIIFLMIFLIKENKLITTESCVLLKIETNIFTNMLDIKNIRKNNEEKNTYGDTIINNIIAKNKIPHFNIKKIYIEKNIFTIETNQTTIKAINEISKNLGSKEIEHLLKIKGVNIRKLAELIFRYKDESINLYLLLKLFEITNNEYSNLKSLMKSNFYIPLKKINKITNLNLKIKTNQKGRKYNHDTELKIIGYFDNEYLKNKNIELKEYFEKRQNKHNKHNKLCLILSLPTIIFEPLIYVCNHIPLHYIF